LYAEAANGANRVDHSSRKGADKPERVADGDSKFTGTDIGRIGHVRSGKIGGPNSNGSEVAPGIVLGYSCAILPSVPKLNTEM
jgi:hypothetical protein